MSDFLDAKDHLYRVRDLIELIGMTCRENPDDDQKAISTGCAFALEELRTAMALLEEVQPEGA